MIASLTGKVLASSNGQVVVDVHGVGYLVHTTTGKTPRLSVGATATFFTSLVVREDALTIFGFLTTDELDAFELLRSVNGVGPKSALAILAQLSVDKVSQAIADESDATFKAVSGIGAKTAKLIVLTLAGKMIAGGSASPEPRGFESAVSALVGLGWSERQARESVSKVKGTDLSDQDLLKAALQLLSKARKA
ncbi:unannotated protein [freshwater metagenome]|uniref:Unannotated protein n=1 Tax=freshwater metagenome TaxID=449393 RepID=A0A6J6IYQ3_9ZZZZ|nr:Holliday junction branch migration protein RuvA [Actinomycetota bacterium]